MRFRFLALAVLLPACGSILGVEPLDVREQVLSDGGVPKDAATPTSDGGTTEPPSGDAEAGAPPPPAATLPPEGTYQYTASAGDGDTLTLSGVTVSQLGYSTPTISITHDDAGCFSETLVLRGNYSDTLSTFCIDGPTLGAKQDHRTQGFQIGSADTTATCANDVYFTTQPEPGDQWLHDCNGSNTAQKNATSDSSRFEEKGEYVFQEAATVPVNGTEVPVYHFHVELTVTGAQTGTNTADWYLAKTSGIPVKLVRSIHIAYSSQFGPVTYSETVDMTIQSPPP